MIRHLYVDNYSEDSELKAAIEAAFPDLAPNDKFIIEDAQGKVVRKVKYKGEGKPLREVNYPSFHGVKLATDHEQQFVLDDILDDEIQLVTVVGHAGTGKTFISVLGALWASQSNLIYTRENIEVGKSLGFLPGGIEDKFEPYMRGLQDNLDAIKMYTKKNNIEEKKNLECIPVAYLRGANLVDTIMIVDEAQNSDLHVTKMLVSRIATGSKIVLCGSFNQIDNKALTKDSNGLATILRRFRGQKIYGHSELTQDRRSELARLCDELL